MKYILKDGFRKQSCVEHINKLDLRHAYAVEITLYRPNRSRSQNNTYWMWLPYLAEYFGYKIVEEFHEEVKINFLGWIPKKTRGSFGKPPVEYLVPKSTTELSVQEFTDLLEKLLALAEGHNIKLPMPDDLKLALGLDEIDKRCGEQK